MSCNYQAGREERGMQSSRVLPTVLQGRLYRELEDIPVINLYNKSKSKNIATCWPNVWRKNISRWMCNDVTRKDRSAVLAGHHAMLIFYGAKQLAILSFVYHPNLSYIINRGCLCASLALLVQTILYISMQWNTHTWPAKTQASLPLLPSLFPLLLLPPYHLATL